MIIPDINLLLYAYDSSSPFNAKAVSWLQACFSGQERIGFLHVVTFGFVRLATSRRVFQNPMSVSDATRIVRSWLIQPVAERVVAGSDHVENVLNLLDGVGIAGNLVTDVQIAAIAMERHAVVHTADADFLRFPGLKWWNPVMGTGSPRLKPG